MDEIEVFVHESESSQHLMLYSVCIQRILIKCYAKEKD